MGSIHYPLQRAAKYEAASREEIVRRVLAAPPALSNALLAEQVGCSRETVRRVRIGMLWASTLPALPRLTADSYTARCTACVHWNATAESCGMGFPEAQDNPRWARECAAFTGAQQ